MSVQESTWNDFQDLGLLWWVNRGLHVFGWAILFEQNLETGEVLRVYPARVEWRPFGPDHEAEGFRKIRRAIVEEASSIVEGAGFKTPNAQEPVTTD